jgi:hypothetical protein
MWPAVVPTPLPAFPAIAPPLAFPLSYALMNQVVTRTCPF